MLTCSSSWLIAAYRVLLRFETPRHPPYALINLTYVFSLLRYFRFILICYSEALIHSALHLGHLFRSAVVDKSST